MGGKSARRAGNAAAEESRKQSEAYAIQTASLTEKKKLEEAKSQRYLRRSLMSRGGGFFETDTVQPIGVAPTPPNTPANTLGAATVQSRRLFSNGYR